MSKSSGKNRRNNANAAMAVGSKQPILANPGMPNTIDSATKMESWAMRSNPYFQTLDRPAEVLGVRIPDDCTIKTATFTCVKRFQCTVTSGGVAACLIGQVYDGNPYGYIIPNPASSTVGGTATTYVVGVKNHATATATTLFSNLATTAGSPPIVLDQWASTNMAVPNLISNVRLVSGMISAKSTVATMSNSGIYTAGFLPKGYMGSIPSGGSNIGTISADFVAAVPGSVQEQVSTGKGVMIKYQPTDSTCTTYVDTTRDPSSLSSADQDLSNPGAFLWCVTGAAAGSIIQCTLVLNYEGVPRTGNLAYTNELGSAISDPIAIAEAGNSIRDRPTASPGSDITDSLHSSEFASSGIAHPLIAKQGLVNARQGGFLAVHSGPMECRCYPGGGGDMQPIKQDESLFDSAAGILGSLVKSIGPKLLEKAPQMLMSMI